MSTKIIYHQVKPGVNCPDGIAAAWVAARRYPNAKIIGCVYQGDLPQVNPGDFLVIVDFSFPAHVLETWADVDCDVTVIDHHKTALENLSGLTNRILQQFNMAECGATLTWQHFFPDEPLPVFLEFVRDRDLWQFRLPETPAVHEAMSSLGRTFELFDLLISMDKAELLGYLLPIGEPLVEEKQRKVEAIAKRYQWTEIGGYKVPFVKLYKDEERFTSDVCSFLYKSIPDAPFVACLRASCIDWELRSDQSGRNFDVGELARKYGGGGHRNAAGFRI